MSELRRGLLDDSDAPLELSSELAFLASRQAGAAVLLQHHRELYPALYDRLRREGPSAELTALALAAAGDLATVLQSLRARQDLLEVLETTPEAPAPPMPVLDQLQFSFLLLTEAASEEQREACLTPDALDELLGAQRVQDWLRLATGA